MTETSTMRNADTPADATEMPRPEHPNPQFYRPDCLILNGVWEFEFDDKNRGLQEQWNREHTFSRTITVPFAFQSNLSGIDESSFHDIVWYRRWVVIPAAFTGKRILLHFGAVDYTATVWINGEIAAMHEGGHTPFSADVTELLQSGNNAIVVRAQDNSRDLAQPRGKQYWEEHSASIFYTRTTGIWQTVWLEPLSPVHIGRVKLTPRLDEKAIDLSVTVGGWELAAADAHELHVEIRFAGDLVAHDRFFLAAANSQQRVSLNPEPNHPTHAWSPEHPHLYDITYTLVAGGQVQDRVEGYFGLRKIAVEQGKIMLNNRPYYMRMVLDQGYFPDGGLTAPSDEAIRRDIELTKAMGFNGARKHQKIEDPRYLYWCDKMGLLVWGEMANAYIYSEMAVNRLVSEWQQVVKRDYNHPCIVAWVPLNESWGVPELLVDSRQRAFLTSLYYLTKALDSTRLVISNDGWEHTVSDLCTIHDYASDKQVLKTRYASADTAVSSTPGQRLLYSPGFQYKGEPIVVTEMGGISFRKSDWNGWGYSSAQSDEDFIKRYATVIAAMVESPAIQGFCYTQLTDVEQEINGLLTYDRIPKVPLEIIRSITEGHGIPAAAE
ncbi:MAG: glycoside hydrolase family 2 protein [Bacilli bacterium]